ncbi:hypothetical protein [Kordiimonas marina]|uniref:hypothetical protein n=1 Tax=Kordiimonas marina TaxID=2872312 RepID=UPI001FF2021D|nr:hypothetical protein [Kordiimonas marina]MCJ9429670.1 hypothetical protein [Kordiimonas marina]
MDGMNKSAFGPAIGPVSMLADLRMTVDLLLEHRLKIPVYFRERYDLMRYLRRAHFEIRPIGRRSTDNVFAVHNEFARFVWARTGYTCFRQALADVATGPMYRDDRASMQFVHVDHVQNRRAVREHPNSWLMLFPLEKGVNSWYGSRIERGYKVARWVDHLCLTPIQAFKIFVSRYPKTQQEFELATRDILGQTQQLETWRYIVEGSAKALGYAMKEPSELPPIDDEAFEQGAYVAKMLLNPMYHPEA